MEKFLGQDYHEDQRWQFLQDNADAVEEIAWLTLLYIKTQTKR